jgi:beta-galactosidase
VGFAEIPLASPAPAAPVVGRLTDVPMDPRLTLWRAPTDNDRWSGLSAQWEAAGLRTLAAAGPDTVATGRGELITWETQAWALGEGGVRVEHRIVLPEGLVDVPRIGVVLELDDVFSEVTWYGRGPHECYPDRRAGAALGTWTCRIEELHVPYIRPQESGGRADVRWLELSGSDGRTVRVELDDPAQVTVSRYSAEDLTDATHASDLQPSGRLFVTLDAAHRGLGTASCGPDTLPAYRVGPGERRLTWTVWDSAAG